MKIKGIQSTLDYIPYPKSQDIVGPLRACGCAAVVSNKKTPRCCHKTKSRVERGLESALQEGSSGEWQKCMDDLNLIESDMSSAMGCQHIV